MLTLLDVLPLLRAKKLNVKHLEKYALDLVLAQDDITARELVDEVEKHVPVQHGKTPTEPSRLAVDVTTALADLRALGVTVVTNSDILAQTVTVRRAAGKHTTDISTQSVGRTAGALGAKRVAEGEQIRIHGSLRRLWWLGEGQPPVDRSTLEQLWLKDSEVLTKHFAGVQL